MTANERYYFPIQVRYADTDAQGHVFFGNYFTLVSGNPEAS